jgi:hypothetical protein
MNKILSVSCYCAPYLLVKWSPPDEGEANAVGGINRASAGSAASPGYPDIVPTTMTIRYKRTRGGHRH